MAKEKKRTIKDQGEKQVHALKFLEFSDKPLPSIKYFTSKERVNPEIIDEIERIEEEERKVDRNKMVYKGSNETYDFREFKAIRVFGNEIRNNIINMSMANDKQDQLLRRINEFKSKPRTQNFESKKVKEDVLNSTRALLKEREMVFRAFESGIFLRPEKLEKGTGLKILTLKKTLQRLPIALAQIKSDRLLNKIRQIVYSCINQKKLLKKYNNIIKSIKV